MRRTDRINYRAIFIAGIAFVAVAGIAPVAQSGSMGNGAAQRKAANEAQAAKDQATARHCQAEPASMTSQACKDAMARHPEMFKGGKKAGKTTH